MKNETPCERDFAMLNNSHVGGNCRIGMNHCRPHQQFGQRVSPEGEKQIGWKTVSRLNQQFQSRQHGKRSMFYRTDGGGDFRDQRADALRPFHAGLNRGSRRSRFFGGKAGSLTDQSS